MRSIAIFLLLVCALAWHSSRAYAGYAIEQGNGVPVCEAYVENLNSFSPKGPPRQRQINAQFPDLRKVEWDYPPEGPFPADQVVELFWNRDANPFWYLTPDDRAHWQGTPEQIENAKANYLRRIGSEAEGFDQSVSFRVARVDIDNDGRIDYLLQYRPNSLARLLLVSLDDRSGIDRARSELVMRHTPWGDKAAKGTRGTSVEGASKADRRPVDVEPPIQDALHGATYDVFVYQARTYFDLWWLIDLRQAQTTRPSESQYRLQVFTITNGRTAKICSLRFD